LKYCSLCNNPYDDNVKNCQLSHCVSCGSTRIHVDKKMEVNPIALIVIVGLFGLIFWALIFDKMDEITFVITMLGIFMGWFIVGSYSSKTVYLCLNCLAKGFSPIIKAPLQNSKVSKEDSDQILKNIDPQDIAKLTSSNLKMKNRFDFRSILLIIMIGIAVLALVFGDIIKKSVESGFSG